MVMQMPEMRGMLCTKKPTHSLPSCCMQGYRDAQCGWAAPPPGHPWEHHRVVLVLYAPKRQILEVWAPGDTKRIAAVNVAGPCVLLPAPAPCGGWQSPAAGVWHSKHPASTLVLQLQTGQVWDVLEGMVG
jgi:hypothetical protein